MDENLVSLWGNFSLVEEEEDELEITAPVIEGLAQRGKLCLLGKLIADRLISKETIRSKLIRGWRPLGTISFTVLGENLFLLEFQYECDRIRVLEGRPWVFEKNLFAVEEFDGFSSPSEMVFDKAAFWVRIFNLPLVCMGMEIGKQIGASIGEVEMVETDDEGVGWGEYLRARIKIDLTKPLLRGRRLKIHGNSIWVRFQYEHLPHFCFECGVIKHGRGGCPKRTISRMKKGEPEYGLWLRAHSPTRRFNTGFNSRSGRNSPKYSNQYRGEESGGTESSTCKGSLSKMEGEGGGRMKAPAVSKQIGGRTEPGVIGFLENQSMNHGTGTVSGVRSEIKSINEFSGENLTVNKCRIRFNVTEGEGCSGNISLRKEKGAAIMDSINGGQEIMALNVDTISGEERGSMVNIDDSGKFSVGSSAATKKNSLSSKLKGKALNENKSSRKGAKAGSVLKTFGGHVEKEKLIPLQSIGMPHVQNDSIEPGHSNSVQSGTVSRNETHNLRGSTWKRRARGCSSLPTVQAFQEKSLRKRGGTSEEGDVSQGKRGRIMKEEDGPICRNKNDGSGMAVVAVQPRRPE
jgi:hypothetical protein